MAGWKSEWTAFYKLFPFHTIEKWKTWGQCTKQSEGYEK